jgi:hypothetical protein
MENFVKHRALLFMEYVRRYLELSMEYAFKKRNLASWKVAIIWSTACEFKNPNPSS